MKKHTPGPGERPVTDEERRLDRIFIMTYYSTLATFASDGAKVSGRRGIVVVGRQESTDPLLMAFVPLEFVPDDLPEARRMVEEYDQEREFVVHLLKEGDNCSTYRMRVLPAPADAAQLN